MQQLANLVRFDGKKEPYMTPFNNFIISKSDSMKIFIKCVALSCLFFLNFKTSQNRKLSSLPEEAIEKKSSPSQQRRSTAVDIVSFHVANFCFLIAPVLDPMEQEQKERKSCQEGQRRSQRGHSGED